MKIHEELDHWHPELSVGARTESVTVDDVTSDHPVVVSSSCHFVLEEHPEVQIVLDFGVVPASHQF